MGTFNISVDLSEVLEAGQGILADEFKRTHEAIGAIASMAHKQWIDGVSKAPGIWYVEKNQYINSIRWEYTGDFSARVWSDYKYADEIDNGRPARDLKKMLDTSLKVRISRSGAHQGGRYLIIPFRHNTPGNTAHARDMPADVYAAAKTLAPSRVTGTSRRISELDVYGAKSKRPLTVARQHYEWGGALPPGMAPKLKPHHASDPYAGMVRFDTKGKGGKASSSYLTFRVMTEWSNGWIVPAKPGLMLLPKIVADLQPKAEMIIARAAQLDLGGR